MRRILLCLLILPVTAFAADGFKLNAQEYFERPGINVMYGQDYYPEGHQGGLSVIMHDERIASNGDVRLEPSPGSVVADSETRQARGERGHAGNPRAACVPGRRARSQGFQSHRLSGPEAQLHGACAPRGRIHPRERRFRCADSEGVGGQGRLQPRTIPGSAVRQVLATRKGRRRFPAAAQRSGRGAHPGAWTRGSKLRRRPSCIT